LPPGGQEDTDRKDGICDGGITEVGVTSSGRDVMLIRICREGKVGAIGLSEVSEATIRRAEKVHHIDAVQIEYSPFALDIESPQIGILKACRELGIAVVAYSPLGRGFLTGQIKSPDDFENGDFRKHAPRYNKENFYKNLELVAKLQDFAKKKGCTSGQLSLAWLLAQGDDIIPIP
jgi:aryl-alcohol dehydrogenase-like predicted oxidoreductase